MTIDRSGPFEAVAHVFAPADPSAPHTIVDAGRRWTIDSRRFGHDLAIWGSPPTPPGGVGAAARWALRRECAISRLRLLGVSGLSLQRLHRLRPPRSGGSPRGLLRAFALGGAIAELAARPAPERVIDAVLAAAGAAEMPTPPVRASRDGSVLVRVRTAHGPAELRIVLADEPGRLESATAALRLLAGANVTLVPRPIGSGTTAGTSWTTETVAPGTPPRRLTSELLSDVVAFAAQLAISQSAITALRDDLGAMATVVPRASVQLSRVATALRMDLARLPAVVQHGDLLLSNLLTQQGRLTGVVDWETWHPAGVPGVDLLQLVVFDGLGLGGHVGSIWRVRPWQSPTYRRLTQPYFAALGVEVDDRLLHAVAVAWWANRIRVLRRRPERRSLFDNPTWIKANVADVLESVCRELGLPDGGAA